MCGTFVAHKGNRTPRGGVYTFMILITSGGVDHLREEQESLGLPKNGRTKCKLDYLRQYGFLMT